MMIKKIVFLLLAGCAIMACKKDKDKVIELSNDVEYTFTITVEGLWAEKTHPTDYPEDAAFANVLAVAHKGDHILFKEGSRAADWLKSYAKDASTTNFDSTFSEYKNNERIYTYANADGCTATGTTSFTITTNGRYDKLSLITKITPSPDWFIALENIDLNNLSKGGSLTFVPMLYDAGVKSGTTYTEAGNDTNEAIVYKKGAPVAYPNGGVNNFATITVSYTSSKKAEE